jgi:DNA repair exonuclease SbcCD ATPase subunit
MENVLQFIATYNTQLIKAGFGIVFLLLIVYVYRLFFVTSAATTGGAVGSDAIEQKINQLLENHKLKSGSASPEDAAEVDRLKAENLNLKQQVEEVQTKIASSAQTPEAIESNKQQLEQIKSLESRLAEYEIISEDIAELTQLRAENAKLKEIVAGQSEQPANDVQADADGKSADEKEIEEAIAQAAAAAELSAAEKEIAEVQGFASEPVVQSAPTESSGSTGVSAQDAADTIVAALAAANEESTQIVTEAVPEPVVETPMSDEDKKLLAEFDQTIVKKG